MRFFVGLHQPSDARHFDDVCVSINRLRRLRSPFFEVGRWIMDSAAFTELATYGRYRHTVEEYAAAARRWVRCGRLLAVIAQDYMCEPFILKKTGLSVRDHQQLTIERFDELEAADLGVAIMPTIQGYEPRDYQRHVEMYGARLGHRRWVGVGSVCKRNGSPGEVTAVLAAIGEVRADLRLHGFGLKLTSLADRQITTRLFSADSMAWSYSARKQGRSPNDWREAKAFEKKVAAVARGH